MQSKGSAKLNDTCNAWKMNEWLNNAKQLLAWIRSQRESHPLVLVIRHSHREDSKDAHELSKMRLTDLGHRMAFCFGKKLPSNREVEISHSGHPRCQETAFGICKGYTEVGGDAKLVSVSQVNLVPQAGKNRISNEMVKLGGVEFIKRWVNGNLSDDVIISIEKFRDSFLEGIFVQLRKSVNSFHIHVTHDLHIMTLRNILFSTILSGANWIPYLGGFGIILKKNELLGFDNRNEQTINDENLIKLLIRDDDNL